MKKLKILYTIPNFDTAGSGKVVYDLVKGLDKEHFAPEILVKHTKGAFFKEVEQLGVPIHVFNYETDYKPFWSFPFRLLKVIRFFKQHDWDIVHSWHWSSDVSEPLAVRLSGKKFVYTKKNMGWGNKAWVWKSRLSHKIIAINKDMMKNFFEPIQALNAIYLPLGVDLDYFQPREQNVSLMNELGLKKTDFIIATVANLVPLKGIETLIKAFFEAEITNSKLLIVGNNNNAYGRKLINEFADERIIFVGKQINVRPYLAISNLFCIPTEAIGEGMPLAPVEAMSMGVPVIGSKVSGITDILEGFEEWLFKASDINELINKLHKMNSLSFEERKNIGQLMRDKVVKEYSHKLFIETREKLYKDL
ncbi:glycosyltransferase [Psychroflexus salinarum]|uniref:Glycosyltransferase n=1 Tax=Psychroflexus salinarum TaxID=546024 RepID=A0ABW3GUK3_9FLAO